MSTLDRLIASLNARIDASRKGDPQPVLEAHAMNEARELFAHMRPDDASRTDVMIVLANFHWQRSRAVPEEASYQDLMLALMGFGEVRHTRPDVVPEALRGYLSDAQADADLQAQRAISLLEQAQRRHDVGALEEAIMLGREAVAATGNGHPGRAGMLSRLSNSLRIRYAWGGDDIALEEAIAFGREAVNAAPVGHPDRVFCLSDLVGALGSRFERTGNREDLHETIMLGREALDATPVDHPYRAVCLSSLSNCLRVRFALRSDHADLEQAIALSQHAVAATPEGHPHLAMYVSNLGAALMSRYEWTRNPEDLDSAITQFRRAVGVSFDNDPQGVEYLSNLGSAMRARFDRTGNRFDLDEAIDLLQKVIAGTAPDVPNYPILLSNFVAVLTVRLEQTGGSAGLNESIDLLRRALDAIHPNSPSRPELQSMLAGTLQMRFGRAGIVADLDEAIKLGRQAVAGASADHPSRPAYLSNLLTAFGIRFGQTGDEADLEETIALGRRLASATTAGHPHHTTCLFNLGAALRTRYERTGDSDDLEQTITLFRQAVDATADDHPAHAMCLFNLGAALRLRFDLTKASVDLNDAISFGEKAVTAIPGGHLDHASYLSHLATAVRLRFEHTGQSEDLNSAIELGRQAAAEIPLDHPGRARCLSGLASALQLRFVRLRADADLDQAVALGRDALSITPAGHPQRPGYASNVANTLMLRFQQTGDSVQLDDAIVLFRQAVAATPDNHPHHASVLFNLGQALQLRFERDGVNADLDEAVSGWQQASQSIAAAVTTRLTAASWWARAVGRWRGPAEAVEAYAEAVALLPLLAWRGISHRDQHRLLNQYASELAREAAASAIAAGQLPGAIELLETGRGVYWSQLQGSRADLNDLRRAAPDLGKEMTECRALLEQPSPDSNTNPSHVAQARMTAARRFDRLVEQVRALPPSTEFPRPDRFLKTPELHGLLPGPDEPPVIVVNVSHWRCDALILTPAGVDLLALPTLTEEQVIDRTNRYLLALQADDDRLEEAITSTLEWLWESVAAPILEHMGHSATPTGQWPRVQWCLTGALTVLPVHAAGVHSRTPDTVLDRVVSSYTPTLSTARRASADLAKSETKILVISLPETPGQSPLLAAGRERETLAKIFGPSACTILSGADATHHAVLEKMRRHQRLHASCHGTQSLADPTTGGLMPFDWKTAGLVTISDLTQIANTGGEFAFLSACQTATGSVTSPDEAITVAAAMQHAGWRHVIGTLWSVSDSGAAVVARNLYSRLVDGYGLDLANTASALHQTVRELRDARPDRPSLWALYIHTGP